MNHPDAEKKEEAPSLATALLKEVERCQELLSDYAAIGPAGVFGHHMISLNLKEANRAMIDGDLVGMLKAYEALKECN